MNQLAREYEEALAYFRYVRNEYRDAMQELRQPSPANFSPPPHLLPPPPSSSSHPSPHPTSPPPPNPTPTSPPHPAPAAPPLTHELEPIHRFHDPISRTAWHTMCYSPDGAWLAGGAADNAHHKVYIWDVANEGQFAAALDGGREPLVHVHVSLSRPCRLRAGLFVL